MVTGRSDRFFAERASAHCIPFFSLLIFIDNFSIVEPSHTLRTYDTFLSTSASQQAYYTVSLFVFVYIPLFELSYQMGLAG